MTERIGQVTVDTWRKVFRGAIGALGFLESTAQAQRRPRPRPSFAEWNAMLQWDSSAGLLLRILIRRHGDITITREEYEWALSQKATRSHLLVAEPQADRDALTISARPVNPPVANLREAFRGGCE
jgi:hypothetical protein